MDNQQTREIAPGVRGYVESGDWGTAIYEWAGDGKGRTRAALLALARPVTVIDPGEPGTASYTYWQKMLAEGLVERVLDDENQDITMSMRGDFMADETLSREMLQLMEAAQLCGPFVRKACGHGKVKVLRAIDQLLGRERFRSWLEAADAEEGGPFVAAAAGWHVEVFRFLLEVRGGVSFKLAEKFPGAFSFSFEKAVDCPALEAALGVHPIYARDRRPVPVHELKRFAPCATIVQMILEAHPEIQPHTLVDRQVKIADFDRFDSILGWAIRMESPQLVDMLMSRKPVISESDLSLAIQSGNVALVKRMVSGLKVMPLNSLRAIEKMPHEDQAEILRDLPKMPLDREPLLADVVAAGFYAPEAYRAMHKTFGVDRQLVLLGAARVGSVEGVREMVLRCRAKPDERYHDPRSDATLGPALHLARDGDTVRALVECGADVEAKDTNGMTPLQSWLDDTPVEARVPQLVDKIFRIAECGADLAVKRGDRTLMRMAYRWPQQEVRRALKAAKLGVKLGAAMDGEPEHDGAPAAPARADPSPL